MNGAEADETNGVFLQPIIQQSVALPSELSAFAETADDEKSYKWKSKYARYNRDDDGLGCDCGVKWNEIFLIKIEIFPSDMSFPPVFIQSFTLRPEITFRMESQLATETIKLTCRVDIYSRPLIAGQCGGDWRGFRERKGSCSRRYKLVCLHIHLSDFYRTSTLLLLFAFPKFLPQAREQLFPIIFIATFPKSFVSLIESIITCSHLACRIWKLY